MPKHGLRVVRLPMSIKWIEIGCEPDQQNWMRGLRQKSVALRRFSGLWQSSFVDTGAMVPLRQVLFRSSIIQLPELQTLENSGADKPAAGAEDTDAAAKRQQALLNAAPPKTVSLRSAVLACFFAPAK